MAEMELAGNVARRMISAGRNNAQSRPQERVQAHTTKDDTTLVDVLWIKMTEIYGHKWMSSFGEKPTGTWTKVLNQIGRKQMALGLKRCFDRTDPWPPSLVEFRQLCYDPSARKDFIFTQIADKSVGSEQLAFMDCNREMSPGDPGFTEYYASRVAYYEDQGHEDQGHS